MHREKQATAQLFVSDEFAMGGQVFANRFSWPRPILLAYRVTVDVTILNYHVAPERDYGAIEFHFSKHVFLVMIRVEEDYDLFALRTSAKHFDQ